MKPRIAITASLGRVGRELRIHLLPAYAEAVAQAGGEPLILSPLGRAGDEAVTDLADGLLLAGGPDLDAALWNEPTHPAADVIDPRRQQADLAYLAQADEAGMPVLGICLGIQEMAVHRGGAICQHLPDEPGLLTHKAAKGDPEAMHHVTVEAGSRLADLVGQGTVEVNSSHHQAVREPGRGMRVVARSPDGIIEGVEDPSRGRFFVGVQWHPERIPDRPPSRALFEALCRAASEFRTG